MNKQQCVIICQFLLFFGLLFAGPTLQTSAMVDDAYLSNPVVNEEEENQSGDLVDSTSTPKVGILDYIKVLFALIFVLGLLLFVLRFLNKKNSVYQQTSGIQNLGGVSVGPQKSVQVLKVGSQVLIVGVGDDVRVLSEVKDEKEIESILNSFDYEVTGQSKPYMFELLNKLSKKKTTHTSGESGKEFGEVFDKTLSELKKERSNELDRWK